MSPTELIIFHEVEGGKFSELFFLPSLTQLHINFVTPNCTLPQATTMYDGSASVCDMATATQVFQNSTTKDIV